MTSAQRILLAVRPFRFRDLFKLPRFSPATRRVVSKLAYCLLICSLVANVSRADDDPESDGSDNSEIKSQPSETPTNFGNSANLPRPSSMSVNEFEAILFEFVNQRKYQELGWMVDKGVRDTGPFLNGKYYGTHPAVRIFYSPEIMQWLVNNKKDAIPDGAVIIKEQYSPPAARHSGADNEQLWEALESWTIMVKDSKGSHDGWFWSNPGKNQKVVDYYSYPFEEPYSGFGIYCVRCHGSTKSSGVTNEYTFSSLRNIQGFPGEPLLFRVDDSWRQPIDHDTSNEELLADVVSAEEKQGEPVDEISISVAAQDSHPRCAEGEYPTQCQPKLNSTFLKFFPQLSACVRADIQHIPPVTYDHVPRKPNSAPESKSHQAFVTSDQCMSCHAGLTEPFGPTMFLPTGEAASYGEPGIHFSPYGEWRWTPMGLAGRDPVFFAQLESELAYLEKRYDDQKAEEIGANLQKTCLGCHGVMGKRQHDLDQAPHSKDTFKIADVYRHELDPATKAYQEAHYGSLARDGVSCTVCHRMQPRPQPADDDRPYLEHFLETSITGNFYLGKPGELYGPYKDNELAAYPMEHSLAFKPKHSDYIKTSQMCGTCHTVNLPIVDWKQGPDEGHNDLMLAEPNPAFRDYHHHVEQATYLEWLNSQYENEIHTANPRGKSCQDCHMSKGLVDEEAGVDIRNLETRIAAIQDHTYPDAENLASHEEIKVRFRKEYSRHNFRGLNVFLLEMFNQFDDVLGVRKHDYMTGSKTDIAHARNDFLRQAKSDTAEIKLETSIESGTLRADVEITSLAGHRFPSGVGFRRAFLELLVTDPTKPEGSQLIWSSGRTNDIGVIVDHQNKPLQTEFFERDPNGKETFQPHHEVITSSDQVQIYETLLHTRGGEFTTSFIHGCTIIKDNRFLPRGWTARGPGGGLKGHFLTATYPGPIAAKDARYQDGSGSDVTTYQIKIPEDSNPKDLKVEATLYYQAIPPYFLKNIFELSDGPAAKRLHYICSNIDLAGTPIEGWKLPVVSAESYPAQ